MIGAPTLAGLHTWQVLCPSLLSLTSTCEVGGKMCNHTTQCTTRNTALPHLLLFEDVVVEVLLQLLVGQVDAELQKDRRQPPAKGRCCSSRVKKSPDHVCGCLKIPQLHKHEKPGSQPCVKSVAAFTLQHGAGSQPAVAARLLAAIHL